MTVILGFMTGIQNEMQNLVINLYSVSIQYLRNYVTNLHHEMKSGVAQWTVPAPAQK